MFTDCHAHIHVREFDVDRAQVIERAKEAGINRLINVGFDVEGNFQALALAKKYDFIYATLGIHPHCASEWNGQVAEKIFKTAKQEERIVALGEMGLDYFKNFQPREVQINAFRGQLALARELDLPVIIHCRDAFEDVYKILSEEKIERVLLHCFTGSIDEANEGWKRGYYTAFTGIITYPSAEKLRDTVHLCPENRLLIETDCPYLPPQSKRGMRNEPAFLAITAGSLAKIRGLSTSDLSDCLQSNVSDFFVI